MTSSVPPLISSTRAQDALALLAGVLHPLAFAPWGWFPVAILSPALLFTCWYRATPRRATWRGWLYGLGMFGAGTSWIHISVHEFGHTGWPPAILVTVLFVAAMALYPALAGYFARRWFTAGAGVTLWLSYPAIWVLSEWARGTFFTGFPWLHLGYSQVASPLGFVAPLLGVYGVSWLVAITAGGIVYVVRSAGTLRWVAAMVILVLWGAAGLLDRVPWTEPAGPKLQVSLLQGNIPQALKWESSQRPLTLALYRDLTDEHWDSDLIVWPETAIPAFYDEVKDSFLRELAQASREQETALVVGLPEYDMDTRRYFNSMIVVGEAPAFYRKRHLVPFGEVFPLRPVFGWLYDSILGPRPDFSPGPAEQPLLRAAGYPIGVSICYEATFGEEIIRDLPAAALLLNASNDAWFGDSIALPQHLQMAQMRARESGRYLLRATNTGISAVITPTGEIAARAPQFTVYALTAEVLPMSGATPYVRIGNRWLLILLVPLLWIAYRNVTGHTVSSRP